MTGDGSYGFRPVTEADLPMLAAWLREPHVAEWWDEPAEMGPAAEIITAMGDAGTTPRIVELDRRPIGYIQSYDPHLEKDHPYRDQPAGTLGIDQFIGVPDLVGIGHGSRIVRALADQLFSQGCRRVVVDPHPGNARAIRAYEKAGFRALGRRTTSFGPALIMALDAPADDR